MAATRREVDEEILISAVQQRTCIWDSRDVAYADRSLKNKAWDEVVTELFPEWPSLSKTEKINKRKAVQTRWRSLKDCYTRELRQMRDAGRSGSSPSKRKQYLFFEDLDFLRPVLETRSTSGNLNRHSGAEQEHDSSDAPTDNTGEPSQGPETTSSASVRQRRRRANESNVPLSGQLSSLIEDRRMHMDDPNYHFSLFMYTVLKKMPKERMDSCRKELWDILQKYLTLSDQPMANISQASTQHTPLANNPNTQSVALPYYPPTNSSLQSTFQNQIQQPFQYNPPPPDYSNMPHNTYGQNLPTNTYQTHYPSYQGQYSAPLMTTVGPPALNFQPNMPSLQRSQPQVQPFTTQQPPQTSWVPPKDIGLQFTLQSHSQLPHNPKQPHHCPHPHWARPEHLRPVTLLSRIWGSSLIDPPKRQWIRLGRHGDFLEHE